MAKSDLFKVPFGGWAMKRAGDLAVHFDAKRAGGWGTVKGSTGQLLAQAAAHFEAGNSICIFPEGNRMGVSAEKCVEAGARPASDASFVGGSSPLIDPRRGRGGAATRRRADSARRGRAAPRLRGLSASRPRRRREASP